MVIFNIFKQEPDIRKLRTTGDIGGLIKAMYYKGNSSVRMEAVLAMQEMGGTTAIHNLAYALENDDTRWLAASALARIGQPAVDALKEIIINGENIYAKKMAERILDKIGYPIDTVTSSTASQADSQEPVKTESIQSSSTASQADSQEPVEIESVQSLLMSI